MKKLLATLLLCTLAACGGGDPEDFDDERAGFEPVKCEVRPEICR